MPASAFAPTLADVDEATLDRLVEVALAGTSADEVTPPVSQGHEWSGARIEWLRRFHRERRTGLNGPAREATWAILSAEQVVGSVRLKATEVPGRLETGIWLARGARGAGLGSMAMVIVLRTAAALGAHSVRADTTAGNTAALHLLRGLGFQLTPGEDDAGIEAVLDLLSSETGATHRI